LVYLCIFVFEWKIKSACDFCWLLAYKIYIYILLKYWAVRYVGLNFFTFQSVILYLSFTYLTFYVYFYFFMLLSNDRTTSCSKSWDRYHFGSAGNSVDFDVYVPINTYRCVEGPIKLCLTLHEKRKTRFDWSKPFEWRRRDVNIGLKRWPIKWNLEG
jgi:hypothetical protein